LTVARKIDNYDKDATGGGLWATTQQYKVTVPSGKRWFLLGGITYRSVSSTLTGAIHDSSDNMLYYVCSAAAATGYVMYPQTTFQLGTPAVLDAGDYVNITFGTAQDANAFCTCVVLEVDV